MQNALSERLLSLGRDLHLIPSIKLVMDGGKTVGKIAERVEKASQELQAINESLI